MRYTVMMVIVMLLSVAAVCNQRPLEPIGESGDGMKGIAEGGNQFGFELYAKIAMEEKGNLFFSPSSIHTALAMTYAGAAGSTAEQMSMTLHYNLPKETLPAVFGEFLKLLNTPRVVRQNEPAYELVVSNALWPAKAYRFKADYIRLIKKEFAATLEEVDYASQPATARKTINDVVALQTRGKIQDLIPQSAITPLTRLILTNAIYFKGKWQNKFWKEMTRQAPFRLAEGKSVSCAMMSTQDRYRYFENDDLQLLEMQYIGRDLSMVVLLPKQVNGLPALEKKLSAGAVSNWLDGAMRTIVQVGFPRFKFAQSFSLGEKLKALGMQDAFSLQTANFSGMTTTEKLCISDVIHKSFVAVDEVGTEAAAATGVAMVGEAAISPQEPKVFTADHPFLFLIRHNESGAILFIGRVASPEGGD